MIDLTPPGIPVALLWAVLSVPILLFAGWFSAVRPSCTPLPRFVAPVALTLLVLGAAVFLVTFLYGGVS